MASISNQILFDWDTNGINSINYMSLNK
jgi:hypothetical protein